MRLERFWAEQGCIIQQPYDIEVGAGTMNPATTLRVLGPEPWRVAYVEPSRRPTDGRYGENPNRLQHYYQYQVIMQPAPEEIQEIYLDSLRALGIDPAELAGDAYNIPAARRPDIDRWILSKYNRLVRDVTAEMDQYDLTKSVRKIQNFVNEDLSNWYIRRNRRRFWGSAMDDDKRAVYRTTWEVLEGLCRLCAHLSRRSH